MNMEAVLFDYRQKQEMFLFFGPQSLVVGPPGLLSTGVKRPRQESDRSNRPTVEVKNY